MKKVLSLVLSLTILFSFTAIALEANSSVISDRINQFVENAVKLVQSMDNGNSNTTNNISSALNLSNKQLISVGAELTDNATAVNINSVINESTVSTNETWTLTSPTTIMSGTVTVKRGYTLTINSNVSGNAVIQKANATNSCWEGNCFVLENGASLIITGTASKKIIFNGLNFADNRGAVIKAVDSPSSVVLTYFSIVNYSNNINSNNLKGTVDIMNCNLVNISNCEFTGCVGNNGGAISVENSNVLSRDNYYGKINSGNVAYQYGGGIYIKDCYFLSVNDCIYGNKASYGGGVYVAESSVTTANAQFYGVDISSNQAIAYSVSEDEGGSTGGSDIGEGPLGSYEENGDGTLDDFPGSISPDDEIISKDEEVITLGGGMYLASKTKVTTTKSNEVGASSFTINDSVFGNISTSKLVPSKVDSNQADSGAGIYIGSNADVEINGATSVSYNKANFNGGGIYVTSTGLYKTTLTYANILNNTANVDVTPAFSTAENPDIGHGAGVYVSVEEGVLTDVNMQMENCSVMSNVCTGYGGALYLDQYTGDRGTNSCIIRSNSIMYNKSTYGGGVYITADVNLPLITGVGGTFINNSILMNDAIYGGGVYSLGTVNDTNHIKNNTAYQGGGLYVASGSYDIWTHNITVDGVSQRRTIICNNKAALSGGEGDDIYMPANAASISFPCDPSYLYDTSKAAWYTDFKNNRYRISATPKLLKTSTGLVSEDGNELKRYKSTGSELALVIVRLVVNIDFDYDDVKYVDPWGNDYNFASKEFADGITYRVSLYNINLEGVLAELTVEDFVNDFDTSKYEITSADGTVKDYYLYEKTENYFTVAKGEKLSIKKLGSNVRVSVTPIFPTSDTEENCIKAVTGLFTGDDKNNTEVNLIAEDNTIGKNNDKSIPVVIKYMSRPLYIPDDFVSITYSSTSITSVVYGTEVAVKYYARSTENGQPTAISTTPSEIKKRFVGSDYFDFFVAPVPKTTNNVTVYKYEDTFGGMISSTGVFLTKTIHGMSNLVDDYCMWTSQASATAGIGERVVPGTETKYKDKYADSYSYRTDAGGVPVNGENWVTYYDSMNTSITLDSNDDADDFTTDDAFKDVKSVTVWIHNTPKTYKVDVYAAKAASGFEEVDGLYVSSVNTLRSYDYQTFYSQRFNGELEDDKNGVSELLSNYPEIEVGYVDEYISTAYRIRGKDASGNTINYYFKYWSFDPEGKNIASTSISYAHRITGNVSLYAVYGLEDSSEFTTEGLTLMKNGVDYFYTGENNETENVRFNVSNSPYNITVTDMYEVSAVFFELDANSNVTEEALIQVFSDYLNNGTEIDASYKSTVCKYNTINKDDESYVEPSGLGRVLFSAEYPCSEIYAADSVTMNKKIVVVSAMKLLDKWTISSNVVTFN